MVKKFFAVFIFVLIVIACDQGSKGDQENKEDTKSQFIGTWIGTYADYENDGVLTLTIDINTWTMGFDDSYGSDTYYSDSWSCKGNHMILYIYRKTAVSLLL